MIQTSMTRRRSEGGVRVVRVRVRAVRIRTRTKRPIRLAHLKLLLWELEHVERRRERAAGEAALEDERADRLGKRRVGREGLERLVREVRAVVGGHAVEAGGGVEDGALLAGAVVEPEGRGDRLARGMRGMG